MNLSCGRLVVLASTRKRVMSRAHWGASCAFVPARRPAIWPAFEGVVELGRLRFALTLFWKAWS